MIVKGLHLQFIAQYGDKCNHLYVNQWFIDNETGRKTEALI